MDKSMIEYWEGSRMWDEDDDRLFSCSIINDASLAFPKGVWEMLDESFDSFKGQIILVPSCGDGICALGFSLLKAIVMATDFREKIVKQVKDKSHEYGLSIEGKTLNSQDLTDEPSNKYDLVFTSYGVLSCMTKKADLEMMFESFHRVLKPGGRYILFDYHPSTEVFSKILIDESNENHLEYQKKLEINKPYWEVHWRTEDYLRTLIKLGFALVDFREIRADLNDIPIYRRRTYISNAFPSWIGINAKKR